MKNWRTDSKKQGSSDPFAQKEFTADAAQIEKLNIDVRDRQIDVSLSEDGQIHISYFENSKETYDISVSDDHVLTMTAAGGKDWTDFIGENPLRKTGKYHCRFRTQVWIRLPCPPPTKRFRFRHWL